MRRSTPPPRATDVVAKRVQRVKCCDGGGASSFPFSAVQQSQEHKRNHARLKVASNPQPGLQNGRERVPISARGEPSNHFDATFTVETSALCREKKN